MKWLKGIIVLIVVLLSAGGYFICTANKFTKDGQLTLKGLNTPAKVLRDEKGMPYIYAETMRDAFLIQGYVTAQERLFQRETTRLFSSGRISELAGDAGRESDIEIRTIGFYRNAKKHAAMLNAESLLLQMILILTPGCSPGPGCP